MVALKRGTPEACGSDPLVIIDHVEIPATVRAYIINVARPVVPGAIYAFKSEDVLHEYSFVVRPSTGF